jgi:predicted MPP superfamily phosphohydrolase
MAKQRYLGITIFGYLAIATGIIFIGIHLWLLQVHQTNIAYIVIGSLFVITLAGFALIRANRNQLVRALRIMAFSWSIASLFGAALFGVSKLFGIKPVPWIIWSVTTAIMAVGLYNAKNAKINKIRVANDFSSELRVAHISDLHLGDIWGKRDVQKVVKQINKLDPDVVLITGDVVDGLKEDTQKLGDLAKLEAPAYSIIGNHDVYANKKTVKEKLEAADVTILQNDLVYENQVPILGLHYKDSHKNISKQLKKISGNDSSVIVMKHEPDIPQSEITNETILCGHTHAGQIWPLHLLGSIEFNFLRGGYTVNNGFVYVHSGTRTWGPPVRLGTRSEIAILQLTPEVDS